MAAPREEPPRSTPGDSVLTGSFDLRSTVIGYVLVVQEFTTLCGQAVAGLVRPQWYVRETMYQIGRVGVGSVFIVVLTGMFTGMVLALQGAVQLQPYGATMYVSRLVSTSVVLELGPVLAALMIAGRVGSGIASEIASLQVTEQIDALRAEGTDPIKKLVTPRLVASLIMVPVLTVITTGMPLLVAFRIATFYL